VIPEADAGPVLGSMITEAARTGTRETGTRFKPFREAMIRADVGWNLFNGPFFGLAVNYGL